MPNEINLDHLSHLVRIATTVQQMSNGEVEEALLKLSPVELAYLDLLLHEMSDIMWNSGFQTQIEESWNSSTFWPTSLPTTGEASDQT